MFSKMAGLSDVTKGALFMTLAALLFSIMNTLVRVASTGLPPLEVAFFRNLFALISMLPWMIRFGGIRTRIFKFHLARAIVGVVGMGMWFTSLALVPLATAVALNFTMPFFIAAGAAAFLGEQVGLRRWSAIAAGFVGMLVILRPGFIEFSPVMVLPVAAAVFMAIATLLLKHITATDRAGTTVLYANLLMTPLSLVPAIFVWVWPDWDQVLVLACLGPLAMFAHLALARAFAAADATAVLPLDYARLPFIALFGFLLFGEVPEIWTWIGAAIIAGSAVYIARREAVLARQKGTTAPPAPVARDI